MIGRYCETEQRLIKAHIIPAGFFRAIGDPSETLEVYTSKSGAPPKRAPVGVYDRSILCSPCDNIFSPWDKRAQDVLLRSSHGHVAIYDGPNLVGWTIQAFDHHRLKLFFLSLLWRASVSTHEFYRRVSVGRFEQELRTTMDASEPGDPTRFSVILARFDAPGYTVMRDPHPDRYDSVNDIRFYLARFVA
jgi:hypothetical protein